MKMYMTVMLRCLLFVSLAWMVYDVVSIEQQFELMERGYTDGFTIYIWNKWPGQLFMVVTGILLLLNIIQLIAARKNKKAKAEDYILPEYDTSDERTTEITGRAVRIAFASVLLSSFFILGSYMLVPNYFLDYVWYPMFLTAAIPVIGLVVYLLSFRILYSR